MLQQPIVWSGRFVRPFLVVISKYPGLQEEVKRAHSWLMDSHIGLDRVQDLVDRWVLATHDEDLGLRAAQATTLGSGGVLDYALHTAQTLRESLLLAQRYSKVHSDTLEIVIISDQQHVSIQIGNWEPEPRALTDFVLGTWYRNHLQPHLVPGELLECCFRYPEPVSLGVHRSVFGHAKLSFAASFNGFSLVHGALDRALVSADAQLHGLHCRQLDIVDWCGSGRQPLSAYVRRILAAELHKGPPTTTRMAHRLQMSRRTLVRRLAREGTSASLLLDELRRQLAARLVVREDLSLREISTSLGFAHVQAFHRCFKRWTGTTPARYRAMAELRIGADFA